MVAKSHATAAWDRRNWVQVTVVRSRSSRRIEPIHRSANVLATSSSHRGAEDLEAFGSEDLVERVDELAAAVSHERSGIGEAVGVAKEQVAGCLGGPGVGRVGGHAGEEDFTGGHVDEEQDVVAAEQGGVDCEEVAVPGPVRVVSSGG